MKWLKRLFQRKPTPKEIAAIFSPINRRSVAQKKRRQRERDEEKALQDETTEALRLYVNSKSA